MVFTTKKVFKALKKLPNKLSRTPDCFPAYFLKRLAKVIAEPLAIIFQMSFDFGELPLDWKIALLNLLFKKGTKSLKENYRPISLTSFSCKLMEQLVKEELLVFFHIILSRFQHGFKAKSSTITQLLETFNEWTLALKDKFLIDVIYLDFAKAFDTVSHQKLLYKLEKYGVSGKFLKWIKEFLVGREIKVVINNSVSKSFPVRSSVPQGSVLGPFLFLVYINDIVDCVKFSQIRLFADDIKLFVKSSSKDYHIQTLRLQQDLDRIHSWSQDWQLQLSNHKCEVLHIRNHSKELICKYKLGNNVLATTELVRDLGVYISHDLKFSKHCEITAKKAMRVTSLIFRTFNSNSRNNFLRAYKSYVRPILEYASAVWNPYLQNDINILEKVQQNFTRRLFYKCKLLPVGYEHRLNYLGLERLKDRRDKIDLYECFKIIHCLNNLQTNDFFKFNL